MPTKNLLAAILFVSLITGFSCRKYSCDSHSNFKTNAEIVGFDMTKCSCCGGYEFTINNMTPPNGGNYFLAQTLPPDFQIDMNGPFPVAVKMDYEIISPTVCNTFIKVNRIARR